MYMIFLITYLLVLSVNKVSSDEELCNTPHPGHSTVPDCNCKFNSVDYAVKHFISPILSNLTTQAFFRYFKVDLDSTCPFWQEAGQCSMEGCSVCPCDEDEIPKPWLEWDGKQGKNKEEYGWISFTGLDNTEEDESLGKISVAEGEERDLRLDGMYNDPINSMNNVVEIDIGTSAGIQSEPDEDFDDTDEWTSLHNYSNRKHKKQDTPNLPSFASAYGYGALFDSYSIDTAEEVVNDASYVNLLENPERFTGYSGPSAQRVWKAIQEENCFGELSDICLEKRIFYRLMSGLQASISTHIARSYRHPDGTWGSNPALYWKAVGDHPDRLNNMYFSFLFLLRAVVRAQEVIRTYPYNTGHPAEDRVVRELLEKLLASSHLAGLNKAEEYHTSSRRHTTSSSSFLTVEDEMDLGGYGSSSDGSTSDSSSEHNLKALLRAGDIPEAAMAAVEECRYGFNESEMFQVSPTLKGPQYWSTLEEKQELRSEFMTKFRNISRIMDCVTCDKCRVWGKLQILGVGTAIKILLHPSEEISIPKASILNSSSDGSSSGSSQNHMDGTSNSNTEQYSSKGDKEGSCEVIDIKHTNRLTLNRQEIIALLNTLNNFAHSLKYASEATAEKVMEVKRLDGIDNNKDQMNHAPIFGTDSSDKNNGNIELNPPINPSKIIGDGGSVLLGFSWSTIVFMGVGYLSPLLMFMAYCLRIRYTATDTTTATATANK